MHVRARPFCVLLLSCTQNGEIVYEPPPVWEPASEIEADCASLCEETIAHGCEMCTTVGCCAENCAESVELTGPCRDVTQAYVRCLGAEGLDNCYDVPPGCGDAWVSWAMCSATGTGCGPVQCSAPEQGCSCRSFCEGTIVEESCVPNGDFFDCTCSVDDEVVTSCTGQLNGCAFFAGCCASHLQTVGM